MPVLAPVATHDEATWYAIDDGAAHAIERYVVSTPASRELLTRPEIVGTAYTSQLRQAVEAALRTAPFQTEVTGRPQQQTCVLHILRGGLSFGVREALSGAYGFVRHGSAFLSSQRRQDADGTWRIAEDLYRKLDVPHDAIVVAGDVVATGTTTDHALDVLGAQAGTRGIRRLLFITIGCARLEDVLARHDRRLREACPEYRGATAVYLEGRFTLARPELRLPLARPGTDLVPREGLLAPEFGASLRDRPTAVLERCVVYDAGARAFDVHHYLEEVLAYWRELHQAARDGLRLEEVLAARGLASTPPVTRGGAEALVAVCDERIQGLEGSEVVRPRWARDDRPLRSLRGGT